MENNTPKKKEVKPRQHDCHMCRKKKKSVLRLCNDCEMVIASAMEGMYRLLAPLQMSLSKDAMGKKVAILSEEGANRVTGVYGILVQMGIREVVEQKDKIKALRESAQAN